MADSNTDELERRLNRTHLVALHAIIELAIKKGLFTREEFRASCQWFGDAFTRIDALANQVENRDLDAPSVDLQAIYNEIEKRLFGG